MKVLFVCYANMNRSQIAEAIFNRFSKKSHATSAGINPRRPGIMLKNSGGLTDHPPVVPMMELGYDLSNARIKKFTRKKGREADKVVFVFGMKKHKKDIPDYVKGFRDVEYWDVPPIKPMPFDEYCIEERKRIRMIKARVMGLIARIG